MSGEPTTGLHEFYRRSRDKCLRAVLVSVGDQDTARASWTRPLPAPGLRGGGQRSRCPAGGLDCHPAGRRQHQDHLPRTADAAGLQRTLRADGVPVSVTFTGQQNPACQPYPSGGGPAFRPFGPRTGPLGGSRFARAEPEGSLRNAAGDRPGHRPLGAAARRRAGDLGLRNAGGSRQFPAGRGPGEGQPAVHRQLIPHQATLARWTATTTSSAGARAAASSVSGAVLPAKPAAAAVTAGDHSGSRRPRNPRVRSAIASGCSSRAKSQASRMCTSAAGTSLR